MFSLLHLETVCSVFRNNSNRTWRLILNCIVLYLGGVSTIALLNKCQSAFFSYMSDYYATKELHMEKRHQDFRKVVINKNIKSR